MLKLDAHGVPTTDAAAEWDLAVQREQKSGIDEYAGFHQWTEAASPVNLGFLAEVLQGPLLTGLAARESVQRLVRAIASVDASELHEAQRLELISFSDSDDDIPDRLWCCHIGVNRFWPITLNTLSLTSLPVFKKSPNQTNYNALVEYCKHPVLQQYFELFDLGFMPMKVASKLGELERQGARASSRYMSLCFCPPIFLSTPAQAEYKHFLKIFGLHAFRGCSDIGHVAYRGDSLDAAIGASADLVIWSPLLFLTQCYPALMKKKKIPIGVRSNGRLLNFSLTHRVYPSVDWNEHYVCLFLICCMLHYNDVFLHTQKRGRRDVDDRCPTNELVHCPVRVGGSGTYSQPFGQVSPNEHFQYPGSAAPTSHALISRHPSHFRTGVDVIAAVERP